MNVFGRIYVITCSVNGKQYVGQTKNTVALRWRYHIYRAKLDLRVIYCAIRKYGINCFSVEEIDTAESLTELNTKEIFHVSRLNTLVPNGYNLTGGGEGKIISELTREKLSKTSFGRRHTQKAKDLISLANKGKKHTEETRKLMRLAQGGLVKKRISPPVLRTVCFKGHPLTPENLHIKPNRSRRCKQCFNDSWARHWAKVAAAKIGASS